MHAAAVSENRSICVVLAPRRRRTAALPAPHGRAQYTSLSLSLSLSLCPAVYAHAGHRVYYTVSPPLVASYCTTQSLAYIGSRSSTSRPVPDRRAQHSAAPHASHLSRNHTVSTQHARQGGGRAWTWEEEEEGTAAWAACRCPWRRRRPRRAAAACGCGCGTPT